MIDLGAAYHQLAEILRHHGLRCSYALTVQVWHHEVEDHEGPAVSFKGPEVSFTASVIHGARCIQAHDAPTLPDALARLDAHLGEYLAETGRSPEPLDLQVALPAPADIDRDHFGHPA